MPGKRNIAFLLAIFLLFGGFFSLYYFYYIPAQRNRLHQYAFSLLERIQTNILLRNRDLGQLYKNTITKQNSREPLRVKLGQLGTSAITLPDTTTTFLCDKPGAVASLKDTTVRFIWSDGWRLVYPIYDTARHKMEYVAIPVTELLEPCFVYRKEFFESFLMVRTCEPAGIILYGADSFGMRQEMSGDSLLLRQKGGGFPQTTDITLKGVPYKLFTWSFLLDRQPVVLCGVVKQSVYYSTIHTIPLKVVYPVIIMLLLAVLALPFLKLYFMGRREPLRNRDFTFAAIAVAIGVAMITLIIIHVLLLMRSDREIRANLKTLSRQIDSCVSRELAQAGHQLAFFDQQLHDRPPKKQDTLRHGLKVKKADGKDSTFIRWKKSAGDTTYHYFNRLSWVDPTGKQLWKVQIDDPATIKFIDVSNRHYYRVFKDTLPPGRTDTGLMVMEPVNSWTSGDFEINLSLRSKVTRRAAVMSTHLYSLQNTILPPGYGYCLMDNAGKVCTHSDIRKALNENFLDETGQLRAIKEAITSHQDTVLNNILLYSKPHSIYIHPLQKPPLFLVTFYDKSFFFAVHLRILVFALMLLTICAALVIAAMVLLYWKPNRHAAFAPADYAQWMLPKSALLPYYKAGSLFMVLYQLLILLSLNERDAYLLLLITCLTPLNVLSALGTLRLYEDTYLPGKQDLLWSRVLALVLLQGACTLLAGICGAVSWREGWLFYGFQGTLFMALLLMVLYVMPDRKDPPQLRWWPADKPAKQELPPPDEKKAGWRVWKWLQWHYLTWHGIFILLLTQCLSSLPAALFTWYAQNHEIRQTVKKGQLHLATQLDQRKSGIDHFLKDHDPAEIPCNYADTIAYARGIYTIYDDTVMRPSARKHALHAFQASRLYQKSEDLYLEAVNRMIPNYNDPLFYPALRNSSSDKRWHWDSCCRDTMELTWHPAREGLFARDTVAHTMPLLIVSDLPDRYFMTQKGLVNLLLIVLGFLLCVGIVSLIRMTVYRFFSLRFVHWQEGGSEPGIPGKPVIQPGNFLDKCYEQTRNREEIDLQGASCLAAYFNQTSTKGHDTATLEKAEEQEALIMKQVADCQLFFDAIWAGCNEEDKLLLMNLAQYGVLNYKNTAGIYRLINNELVTAHNGRLMLMSPAFRYYILTRSEQPEEVEMKKQTMMDSRWHQLRMPLLVIFLLIGIFLFITQEEAFKRVGAILTSVTGVISLLMKFAGDAAAAKK